MFVPSPFSPSNLLKRWVAALAIAAIAAIAWFSGPAIAADLDHGATVFNNNCAACHMGGNNIVMRDKTLKKDALEKYGMNSLEAIVSQAKTGKNAMPSFLGKLTEDDINDVAAYVLDKAEKGW